MSGQDKGEWLQAERGEIQISYKKFFNVRVVRPWHRLPREAVAAPSLEVVKTRLDRALRHPV